MNAGSDFHSVLRSNRCDYHNDIVGSQRYLKRKGMTMDQDETATLREAAEAWHAEFSKAFITSVSESGSYYIKVQYRTMAEMHSAFDATAKLADASRSTDGAL